VPRAPCAPRAPRAPPGLLAAHGMRHPPAHGPATAPPGCVRALRAPRPARTSRPASGPWDASSPRTWARDSLQGPSGVAYRGRAPKCNTGYIPIANINVVQLQPCAMSSRRWIVAYFKGMYCGRMTSTQRSESQNKVLKDGYVKRVQACTCLLKGCWTHFDMQTTWMPARHTTPR